MERSPTRAKRIAHFGVVLALATAALGMAASAANAANRTNEVHDCYGIMYNTDWNQICPNGADVAGQYKTFVDCTSWGTTRQLIEYRPRNNSESIDGEDCNTRINYGGSYTSFLG